MTDKAEAKAKEEKKESYKSDRVHVTVHRKPLCVVEYEIHAEKPLCIEAQKKASKVVGKNVVVPGFRKGKAPVDIVAKRHPHELDKKWQEEIANTAYREAAQLAQVPLVRPDSTVTFKMEHHNIDGAKVILSFETIPSVPSIDPANCVLEETKLPEVNKEKVDETIRQTQMFFSKWESAKERPIKEGDFLILDVDILENDPPEKLFANTRFEVADKSMAKWMQELVIGKKPGDVVEGVSVPDASLSEEEKKEFPPKKVRVTIKSIEEMELPPLDDEFAQKLGVKTVGELKEKIEALLNKKTQEGLREQRREEVTKFLLSHPFDLPPSVTEKEVEFRLKQMMESPQFKKTWDESDEQKRRELVESYKEQSEKAVRLFYLCRKIASDQSINITPKDINMNEPDPLEALLFPSAQPHDPRQPDVKQAEAYSRVLLEKTEDWVISHARTAPAKKKETAPKKTAEKKVDAAPKKKTAAKKSTPQKTAVKKTATKKTAPKKTAAKKTAPKKKAE